MYTMTPDPPSPAGRVRVLGGVVRGPTILDTVAASETTAPHSLTPLLPLLGYGWASASVAGVRAMSFTGTENAQTCVRCLG
jgi:hypothetical protein